MHSSRIDTVPALQIPTTRRPLHSVRSEQVAIRALTRLNSDAGM